jgi:hypothetical protein
MDVNLFARHIRLYTGSTGDDGLDDLVPLCDMLNEAAELPDHVISSDEIQNFVVKLVENIQSGPQRLREWRCLCFLTGVASYNQAKDVITNFAGSSACHPMVVYCAAVISNSSDDAELRYCFMFLGLFAADNDARGAYVYNIASLRGAVLAWFLSDRFVEATCNTQLRAFHAWSHIVDHFYRCARRSAITLLQDGTLCAVKRAVLHVLSLELTESHAKARLPTAIRALQKTLDIAMRVPVKQRASLTDETYKLSRNDMFRLGVHFHGLLCCSVDNEYNVSLLRYADYLLRVLGPDALRTFLLYKPPRSTDAKSIVQLIAEGGTHRGDAWHESAIMKALRLFAESVPEVTDILSALPPPPERVEKDRHCAYPHCEVVGHGLHNNMKKCKRCMMVYYCTRKHQVDHWPLHRKFCAPAAPVPDQAQATSL